MRLPQIRMETTPAKIAIETRDAGLQIEQPSAELAIEQPKPELFIETTPGKLTIDQTEAWESMNLKTVARRIEEAADEGRQALLEGMARRTEEGIRLMEIHKGGNPIADIAGRNSKRPEKYFNIGFIPPPFSVKLNYQPAHVQIDWQVYKSIIKTQTNKPVFRYEPGGVEVSLSQRNSLHIDFVEEG
ncbi:MAG: DUF6470 family protein [Bacillus sp. (in: firmicutes)]